MYLNINKIALLFFLLLVAFCIWKYSTILKLTDKSKNTVYNQPTQTLSINSKIINIELAETSLEKAQGLSGRESLPENSGMLFTWKEKAKPGFWMIDMKFPIDIIWISDNKIVGIAKNALPEPGKSPLQLKHYYPPEPINYVLEVNGWFCDKNNIKVGDMVTFSI